MLEDAHEVESRLAAILAPARARQPRAARGRRGAAAGASARERSAPARACDLARAAARERRARVLGAAVASIGGGGALRRTRAGDRSEVRRSATRRALSSGSALASTVCRSRSSSPLRASACLPVAALERRLDNALDVLVGGARDLPDAPAARCARRSTGASSSSTRTRRRCSRSSQSSQAASSSPTSRR